MSLPGSHLEIMARQWPMPEVRDPDAYGCGAQDPARVGDWMQAFLGGRFWPMDPRPDEIHLIDIAHALSNICRYGGHCERFYSVAEHCVHTSRIVRVGIEAEALMHDASEAYLADLPRPIKRALPDYKVAEAKWEIAIARRFGLFQHLPPAVKTADNQMLRIEARAIMKDPPAAWYMEDIPEPTVVVQIQCWRPEEAKYKFLARAAELGIR